MASSQQRPVSSGSDGGDLQIDERKRKRMLSNRESARRSRMRKQKQIEDLTEESGKLQIENDRVAKRIKATEEAYVEMEAANNVIRAQTMELAERLRFLNSVIDVAEDVNGFSVEMAMIPDPLLKP
ncbi:ocs element-binding factor 1-like, partial [Trifolium medium]|nr:ocs element-binding factor 1-like [Trifolium medium]